jgi:hypothetical protein
VSSPIQATAAVRAWVNGKTNDLVGPGNPLANGAFLLPQRSPDSGAYAVLMRLASPRPDAVAEDADPLNARVGALVYHGDYELSELAAAALADAWNNLNGNPERCPGTGVTILVADNVTLPLYVPQPPDTGETYCFQVTADFMLTSQM